METLVKLIILLTIAAGVIWLVSLGYAYFLIWLIG